ncbi:membrane-associated phosphatidylinositol transfer protein 2-like [Actinia tenebrosa]|uniref:Membrane-associated phosphatidylinositol transfer protein 2-like n=1 Tax=Actinia tenebrosa TaxID=6105 RepID=A0A6P8H2W2_ACTTE|nr:membrane-associated phosphatidylinositol transfer protein 2-like [Actinia tenebrosa]
MLIKEYRIPLPMSVEEYRIAQLYMIQKKSRLESTGEGSGVEILENHPYRNKEGERGQYTKKIYHIGNHLPGWLKAILPKSALRVEEEAWNAYPYTKMRTTCPFVEKFVVDVETYYLPDAGQTENVFNLSPTELSNREVDLIDPIIEEVLPSDYLIEEDPLLYKSKKTNRGPMLPNWLDEYQSDNPPSSVMCAYKLIKVEFKYWGMQNKIEHFIHCGLRRPMLMGHRQAWVWQDEWYGLTMEDIRKLEEETKAILSQTMGKQIDSNQHGNLSDRESDQEGGFANTESRGSVVHVPPLNFANIEGKRGSINEINGSKLELISKYSLEESEGNIPCPPVEINIERHELEREDTPLVYQEREKDFPGVSNMRDSFPRQIRPISFRDGKRGSVTSYESASASLPRRMSKADVMKGWQMTSIETSDSTSEDEFFDAQEELDSPETEPMGSNLLTIQNIELSNSFKSLELDSDSSRGSRESLDSVGSSVIDQARAPTYIHKERLCKKYSDTSTSSITTCKITTLLLVVHGGSQLESGQDSQSKIMDLELIEDSFQTVIKSHYRGAVGRFAIRLVECPSVCSKALNMLSQLCPYVDSDSDTGSCSSGFCPISSSFPISAIPLMVTSSLEYDEMVAAMITATNSVYQEFLRSDEGQGFNGEVSILGDCMGALLVYDALTIPVPYRGRTQSVNSNSSSQFQPSANNSSSSSLNGESGPSSPKIEKARRISAHGPPKNNLAASKGLRMCLSSGNLRENEEYSTGEEMDSQGRRSVSPSEGSTGFTYKERTVSKNSYDGLSMSLDSIDQMAFDFEVSKFFAFGSPIGLVLGSRKFIQGEDYKFLPPRPACTQFYNLFHPFDPSASRIEPLIIQQFGQIPSVSVPRYHHFPLGDGQSHFVKNTIGAFPDIFSNQKASPRLSPHGIPGRPGITRHDSNMSTSSVSSLDSLYERPFEMDSGYAWWGNKRLDYALYCPEGLQQFPTAVLSPLFHVSYWESSDVAAFVVRQILRGEWDISTVSSPSKRGMTFSPSQPREKWLRRRTAIKIKNLNSNHRANDIVVMEGTPQVLSARFMYGPLDMVSLSGEKVDIYVMVQPPSGEYVLLDTVVTTSGGRLSYTIQDDKQLPVGIFPLKMVVRGDHTWVDSNLAVLPPKTESVVFSIDGSFTASVSIRGKDPKVRPGAVDVVRHWQELGYLIIYVTSRPDFQKHKVMSWLAEHNFPYGLVAFGDGITKEIQKHKTEFLRKIINESQVIVHCAYGSVKDISVYSHMGLKPQQIFCVAKHHVRKYEKQAQFLKEGYAVHLNDLSTNAISRPALGNSRLIIRRGCFGLPTRPSKSRHKQLKRTSSDKQRNKGQKLEIQGEGPAISGTFNYSSFRQTKGLSINKIP